MGDQARQAKGGQAKGEQTKGEQTQKGGPWSETLRSLGFAFVLFLILRTFILQTFYITSGSMEGSLLVGDFLVVNRAAIGGRIPFTQMHVPGYSEPRLSDIIVFDPPHTDEFRLVKRLVGLPGDTLEMRERVLYRNGQPQDEPFVKHVGEPDQGHPSMGWQRDHLLDTVDAARYQPTRDTWGPIEIPEGHYFTLGDNRQMSLDSRYWGLLEEWRVEGRVALIYWSYDRESYRAFPFITEARWGRVGHRPD